MAQTASLTTPSTRNQSATARPQNSAQRPDGLRQIRSAVASDGSGTQIDEDPLPLPVANVLRQLRGLSTDQTMTMARAKRLAEQQAELFLSLHGVEIVPVDPMRLLGGLPHLRINYRFNIPTSAATIWNGTDWLIALNISDEDERQRFSLLHEFKHIIDHPYRKRYCSDRHSRRTSLETAELISNYFAACVLMPAKNVTERFTAGERNTAVLARTFGVAEAGMIRRLEELGLDCSSRLPVSTGKCMDFRPEERAEGNTMTMAGACCMSCRDFHEPQPTNTIYQSRKEAINDDDQTFD